METRLLRFPGRPLPRFSIPAAEGGGSGKWPAPCTLSPSGNALSRGGVSGTDRQPAPLRGGAALAVAEVDWSE